MNLNKVLLTAAGLILVSTICVTAVFISKDKIEPGKGLVSKHQLEQENTAEFTVKQKPAFTKIGQIRAMTKPDEKGKSTVIIVTPVLEYRVPDVNFYEELDKKTKKIRDLITDYFNSLSVKEINRKGEDQIKRELLDSINSFMILQQIEKIYFSDYQFL